MLKLQTISAHAACRYTCMSKELRPLDILFNGLLSMQLTVTKKADDNTASASKPALKATKKIQVRIVHDEEDDQASAAAEESRHGQKTLEKVKHACHHSS